MHIFSEERIRALYTMPEAIRDIRKALVHYTQGGIDNPHRTVLDFPERRASILYMPSALAAEGFAAVKVVSIFPENPKVGKRTTRGVILLNETETGEPLALLDASYLTRLRTGAASAIATDHLAKPSASVLAVIGCGKMAEEQVTGILCVRKIGSILLYNRTEERAWQFARRIEEKLEDFSGTIQVVGSADEAIEQADIVICATRSCTPVFSGKRLRPGTHVNGIGSYLPHMQEVDEETVLRSSKIVVDTLEGAREEAGDLIIPAKKGLWDFRKVHGELGELAAGKIPGREREEEITFFKSVGIAFFDLAVASAVFRKGKSLHAGTVVEL
jgi:ornithine cyclodeaminase (EC 4.3.1.12)